MRSVDNDDDDFEATAREALLLAIAESTPRLPETRRKAPSEKCPVALSAVVEVMD